MAASLLLVLVVGSVPAVAIARSVLVGIPLGAAVLLIVSSVGATVATLFGWPLTPCVLAVALTSLVAAGWASFRAPDRLPVRAGTDLGLLALLGVPSVAAFTLFPYLPIQWDARSIWWFHASWFQYGGETVRHSIANPHFSFSHPDYPAGVPAAIALLWRFTGSTENLPIAGTLTAVLTGLAVCGLAAVLVDDHRETANIASALALIMATAALGGGLAAGGYVDVLGAALLVTSLAALTYLPTERLALTAGSLALAGATLTKNEGFVFGIAVLAVAVAATRHRRGRVAIVGAIALAPALAWQVAVASTGATITGDVSASGFLDLWRAEPLRRMSIAGPRVLAETLPFIGPAVLALALVWLAVRRCPVGERHRVDAADLRPAAALVVAALLTDVIVLFVYGAGRIEIRWWLGTSAERVVTTPRLFALASLVVLANVITKLVAPRAAQRAGATSGAGMQ